VSDADRWQRVKDLFQAVLARPPEARQAFLDEACADSQLRREVESLLASHEKAGRFLEAPPFAEAALVDRPQAPSPTLDEGARLGPYEITGSIGSGGMGEVYRARDVRLGRDVAVKILPRELAADADRLDRFEQETRAASALNHPNIVAVYDTGWHEGVPFMVTELLEGQPLSERVALGPLSVRKALECAVQAARGLAAAHERGIVHRDLKPANLFLSSQGQVKILDFGLAKLARRAEGASLLPAGSAPATAPGLVLGTVGYMSPEQVRGEAVDFRSDQFSFGCVLYELLAGQSPFRRPSAAQTMAAILEAEPTPLTVGTRVPGPVAWVVERCLTKDREDRYGATRDLARDLELALSRLSELSAPTAVPPLRRATRKGGMALLGVALAAAGAAGGWWARSEPAAVPVTRYLTYSGSDSSPAAAPDGKTVAFSSSRDGQRRIWLKQLATGSEVPVTAGDDDYPRFSPDGSEILFARNEQGRISLQRVSSLGGEPRRVIEDALYGDFSPDGRRIAFLRQFADATGMTTLVATGGLDGSGVRELARLEGGAFVHPRWSADGRTLAVSETSLQLGEPTVIALIDAHSGNVRTLPSPGNLGIWPGGLAWGGPDEILCSQPESIVGPQTGIGSRVVALNVASRRMRPLLSSAVTTLMIDVLSPGSLVLEARALRQSLREVALDPAAAPRERWLTRGNAADRQPVYSADGEWVVFSSNRSGNLDLWAVSRGSGAVRRLTDDAAQDSDPGFTPAGGLLWSSNRSGHFEIWIAEGDGSGARQLTRDGVDAENPVATPDGRWILYASANPRSRGIMKIRPDGGEATLLIPGNMILPEVSPDGRYLALVADQGSERAALRVARIADGEPVPFEIRLPAWIPGGSIDQGRCRWLPSGRGLAFIARNEGGYAVFVQEFAPGTDTSASRRRVAGLEPDVAAESLAISPDGARLTVSYREQLFSLMLAQDVPGLERVRP
jgi:serine/threonine protein kinase